jgi:hypothetical protein
LLTLDPAVVQAGKEKATESGEEIGGAILGGIITGITPEEAALKGLDAVTGPNNKILGYIKKNNDIRSPSGLFRDEVGKNIVLGIIKGIELGATELNAALKSIIGEGLVTKIGKQEQTESQKGAVAIANAFYNLGNFLSSKVLEGFIGKAKGDESFQGQLYAFLQETYDDEGSDEKLLAVGNQVFAFGAKLSFEVLSGFKTSLLNPANSMGSIIDEWVNASGDMSAKFNGLGVSLSTGLIAGIKSKSKEVQEAVANLVNQGDEAGQDAANTGSPSRLFRDGLGSSIGQGIAVGISSANGMVNSSVRKLVNSGAQYRPDVSNVALSGAANRMASMVTNNTNNYNLGVNTTQSSNAVQRSFAIMKAFKG